MRKLVSIIRWILLGLLVPGILALLAYIFFPLAYLFRRPLRAGRKQGGLIAKLVIPLWIFLDDEEYRKQGHDFGEPWWREAKNLKIDTYWQKFRAAYLWCAVRNPAWNQYELIKPKTGAIDEVVSQDGFLTQDSWPVGFLNFAVLKYVNANGDYADNKGEFLSLAHSILGYSKVWYIIQNRLYWRYSFAGKKFGRWIEIQAGTNDRRYTFRFKIKKAQVFEDLPF